MVIEACLYNIQVIGEAVNQLADDVKNANPQIPWIKRLQAMGVEKYKEGFKVQLHKDALLIPYDWKKQKVVFVNSMSDLFHPDVPLDFIQKVFKVMNENPQHTF